MMTRTSEIFFSPPMIRHLKDAYKKHRSIYDDLDILSFKLLKSGSAPGDRQISRLGEKYSGFEVYKVEHFHVRAINKGSRSGYRIIYTWIGEDLVYIDIYHKSQQENHDDSLIKEVLDSIRSGEKFVEQPDDKSDFLRSL